MKKFRFITMALIAMFMASCSNEEIATPEQEPEYVTVNLGVTGEYLDLSDSPLATRTTTTTDTYGINVYTVTGSGTERYACGLFTSLENVNIKLLKNQKYKFQVGIYVSDEVTLGTGGGTWDGKYFSANRRATIDDSFKYGDYFLENEGVTFRGGQEYDYFYGELTDYTPADNGSVEIGTKRTVYGAHLIAEGLSEGSLNITARSSIGSNGGFYVNLTEAVPEYNGIYCFGDVRSAWFGSAGPVQPVNYYTTKQLTISWTKDDGSETPLGTFDVTFKRNVKTKIRIKVTDTGVQNGIVITREETPMTDDDKEYVIEGGEITEVPVTTTPQ
jgi:hypothetical protein